MAGHGASTPCNPKKPNWKSSNEEVELSLHSSPNLTIGLFGRCCGIEGAGDDCGCRGYCTLQSAVTNGNLLSGAWSYVTHGHIQEGNQILVEFDFGDRKRPAFLCGIEAEDDLHGNL